MRDAVLDAISLGYRNFDTAAVYGTEQVLGEAIAEALKLGLLASREELFITSKLWCERYVTVLSLYLDLYLIHWLISCMEECQRLGLTKSTGVSNFSRNRFETIFSFATIPPAVNQVEISPVWQQKKLIEFCKTQMS
ncbi:hypothetical protein GH714_001239 [Hevea brasiliensis]|uniref:NADP-dependent oxidoreductase domain-containing protein n=1 Tax=Hevea brasiliensis TaxID=3981 RepID=A0A6A6M697_HEVBR|nr:hypothetical protein GH714_001239 [Hevea brasiliensis]